jgi:SAM-dependent methyltransferase
MSGCDTDHWPRHARQWALVGPPLRPGPADVAIAEAAVEGAGAGRAAAPRAVVLGVTPELVTMRWPPGTRVLAVERSRDVIGAIFPAAASPSSSAAPAAAAVRADWRALPCAASSVDVVIGDGSLSNLAFPVDYRRLAGELRRVLAPGGRVVVRLFAAPPRPEALAEVAAALRGGAIGSFHALKWRLAMAVQPAGRNVPVADIGRAFDAIAPDRGGLAAARGWDRAVVDAIDVYRGSALVYSFPTLDEVRAALAPALVELACHTPAYELGDRCPTLVLGAG